MPEETQPQTAEQVASESPDWFNFESTEEQEPSIGASHFTYAEDEVVPGTVEAQAAAPAQEQSAQASSSQTHDYEKRYKDLQSYHDRKRVEWENEQKSIQQKLSEYDQLKALRDAIVSDPNLLTTVEGALVGGRTQPAQQQMPTPPPDFDPMDAMNPSTPSGQWYQAMLQSQIRSAVGDVQSLPQTVTQQVLSVLEQREQQRLKEEQQRQRDAAMRQEFEQFESAHADLTPEQKDQFVAFLSGGPNALGMERLSLENLYTLYSMLTGAQAQQQAPKPAVNPQDVLASRIRQVQSTVPPSVTQIPADGSTAPMTEEEYFNQSLAKSGKPKWKIY